MRKRVAPTSEVDLLVQYRRKRKQMQYSIRESVVQERRNGDHIVGLVDMAGGQRRTRRRKPAGRDRSGNYFQVGMLAFESDELNAAEKLVLCGIASFADNDLGDCWPGIRKLAERCSLAKSTVERAISTLESLGLVKIERGTGRRSNYYQLMDHRQHK